MKSVWINFVEINQSVKLCEMSWIKSSYPLSHPWRMSAAWNCNPFHTSVWLIAWGSIWNKWFSVDLSTSTWHRVSVFLAGLLLLWQTLTLAFYGNPIIYIMCHPCGTFPPNNLNFICHSLVHRFLLSQWEFSLRLLLLCIQRGSSWRVSKSQL